MDKRQILQSKIKQAKAKAELADKRHQEQVLALVSVKNAIIELHELINGQEKPDFNKLAEHLSALDILLDLKPEFAKIATAINKKTVDPEDFSKLAKAILNNKPTPVKFDISKLEKAIIEVQQRIQEQTEQADSRAAEDYKPVRRVIKVGNRFVYDDQPTPSRGGGGGSSGGGGTTDGLTDGQLRATPVSVTETNSAAIKTAVELIDDTVGTVDSTVPTKALLTGGSDGTNILADRAAKISTLNSTSTPLGSNATFTGQWEDSLGYAAAIITGLVDQASATNGAVIQYATDAAGTNIVDTDENTIQLTGEAVTFILPFSARYFRVSYTNGAVAQSAFVITTRLTPQTASSPILPLGATIKLTDGGGLTRAVLAVQNNAGTGVANLSATASGNLPVSISEATAEVPIKALTTLNVGQQSITGTASQVTSAATGRNTICIKALAANTAAVYLGTTSGVTTSNGFELNAGEPIEFDLVEGQAIYAIAASGTQVICKAEVS